ncbi:hypothetical protein V1638_14050 [Pseudarthrobacter sp. J64]|uniref:hypothetical protein n=1 Tax=Pseudarthrobacter sp. J64 TaxID=3116485 RepID=UPI002E81BDC1|nr:hypothetical protein [Pseudarthrobacter sp. J64]MEE2570507.1 hypothetical protein [Pseudarthrobacter sp. J64]
MLKSAITALVAATSLAGIAVPATAAPADSPVLGQPLAQAHAHNDYEHDRPLFDALEHGFTSVEADVWLVDGELLVAHDRKDIQPGVTLESLYLDPLDELVRQQGHSVYPQWDGSLQLLIDIKSDAESTYAAIEQELGEHPAIMSRYSNGTTKTGPVTAVVSGNRPLATMQAMDKRFAFYDGRSGGLASGMPAGLMPLVSDNWTRLFTWQGVGPMPEAERARLQAYVVEAHAAGYRVRFWATPDQAGSARDAVWTELHQAGVDHINTDDLAALQQFLSAQASTSEAATSSASAADGQAFTFGVIGDIPYGAAEIAKFPSRIQDINADEALKFVSHVGDIKNGSTVCSDEYFAMIRSQFDTFEHPLVFTPGDNEWVDCHRTNNGAYNPLERLDTLRAMFFNEPGKTLGENMPVKTQESLGLPENVRFTQNRVAFSVVNIQGSNNSLQPWTGLGETAPTAEQLAEVERRTDAALAQIRETFADAERRNDRAVVLMTQADMFDPSQLAAATDNPEAVSGFREIVAAIIEETNGFDRPVYLINGDSHVFAEDHPLAEGSPWLAIYGQPAGDDLQRITVDGSANATNYVRFAVSGNSAGGADVLSWEKVPFSG